jgi:hypothetical protein
VNLGGIIRVGVQLLSNWGDRCCSTRERTGDSSLIVVGRNGGDWITEGLQQPGWSMSFPAAAALQAARFVANEKSTRSPIRPLRWRLAQPQWSEARTIGRGKQLMFRLDVVGSGRHQADPNNRRCCRAHSDPTRGVEELRNRLAGGWRSSTTSVLKGAAPEEIKPPTYAAYQTFSEGMTKYIAADNANALPLFLRAYDEDTSFTVGLLYASIAATNLRQWARADSMLSGSKPTSRRA